MSLFFSFCQFCNLAKCWLRPFSESTFHHKKSILNTRNYIPPFNIQNMWIRWLEADHFSCNMFLVIDLAVHITQSDQGFWFRMVHNLFPVPLTFLTFLWLLICYPLPILLRKHSKRNASHAASVENIPENTHSGTINAQTLTQSLHTIQCSIFIYTYT